MNETLIEAVKRGDGEAVSGLLDGDRSLLGARSGDVSAILLALYHGHPGIARLFVERGAELGFAEACALGDEPRVGALLDGDPSLLDRRSEDGFTPVSLAVFFRQPAMARMLIERGADVSAQAENAQRVAPLHAAAAVRDHETARLLLEHGADPNGRQQNDHTPLHGAAASGDIDFGKLLLAHGADPAAKAADGKSAADIARDRGHGAFAEWLSGVTS